MVEVKLESPSAETKATFVAKKRLPVIAISTSNATARGPNVPHAIDDVINRLTRVPSVERSTAKPPPPE